MAAIFEPDPDASFDITALVAGCVERDARALLLDAPVLPATFFDLSTGVAGELLRGLSKYRLQLAAVVADPSVHSRRFQEFCREANRGDQFRFFPTRQAALDWLGPGPP